MGMLVGRISYLLKRIRPAADKTVGATPAKPAPAPSRKSSLRFSSCMESSVSNSCSFTPRALQLHERFGYTVLRMPNRSIFLFFLYSASVLCQPPSSRDSAFVMDGHIHVMTRQLLQGLDIGKRYADGHFDLPRARAGG